MDMLFHLKQVFGYNQFRYPQQQIIETCFSKKSVLALMPTGMGKSLVYQFVASLTDSPDLVLVISPLIALMQDQSIKAANFGISATFINSSLSFEQKELRMNEISKGKFQLLFVAPERFQKEEFWDCLKNRKIKLLVVDEAHCISVWGHDFRPDYYRLQIYREKLGLPPLLALTATATKTVQDDICKLFAMDPATQTILGGIERPSLSLKVLDVYGYEEKNETILKILNENKSNNIIIYFSLIQTLEEFANFLNSQRITFLKYHGDLRPDQRKRNQNDFLNGKISIMLATPAFGLGIDKSDVRCVVHYEVPATLEAYFQEAGRAGRDQQLAVAYLLYDQEDLSIQMQFLNWAYPEASFLEKVYDLISSKYGTVSIEGFDYLRDQMVFKNKKDFRVQAAVSILNRWGCLVECDTPFGYEPVRPPNEDDFKLENQTLLKTEQHKKLHSVVQYARNTEECRLKQIYHYFSHQKSEDCGICDVCAS